MIYTLNRREFLTGALSLGATCLSWTGKYPTPRVYKLAQWRAVRGLEELERAFRFLESTSVENQAPGRYEVAGDRMYAIIAQDKTHAPATAQFEAHRKYIDVHYLVRGREMIGSAAAESLRQVKAYTPENDVVMYERPREYKRLSLNPGEFTVFFPGQAHMPGCSTGRSEEIKKVVVKVLTGPS